MPRFTVKVLTSGADDGWAGIVGARSAKEPEMIAFIMMIEAVLALAGLMALCRLTRYQGRRMQLEDRAEHVLQARYRR